MTGTHRDHSGNTWFGSLGHEEGHRVRETEREQTEHSGRSNGRGGVGDRWRRVNRRADGVVCLKNGLDLLLDIHDHVCH